MTQKSKAERRTRRGRSDRPRGRLADLLRALLLMNLIPLLVLGYLLVLRVRGEVEPLTLPSGAGRTLLFLLGVLFLVILVATVSLPAAHRIVKGLESGMGLRRRILAGEEEGSRLGALAVLPGQALVYALAWPLRVGLVLVTFVLLAAFGVLCIRVVVPDFLDEWVTRVPFLAPDQKASAPVGLRIDPQPVGDAVDVVEERDDLGRIVDGAVREADPSQPLDVLLSDARGSSGELHRVVQQGARCLVEARLAVVGADCGHERVVVDLRPEVAGVGFHSVVATVLAAHHHGDHLALGS